VVARPELELQGSDDGQRWQTLEFAYKPGNVPVTPLSLRADAALKDEVRACSYMNTFMYSVHVCIFVNVLHNTFRASCCTV
jgi:hypothetical protein